MKPLFHPQLANNPFGDPALYIEFLFERRALMFDLGEIPRLAPRKILRVSHIFVSHTHMDHFAGFDRVLRICLGREKRLHLFGLPDFIDRVEHKLAGYTWNLVQNYDTDFTIIATEFYAGRALHSARFRCRTGFRCEDRTETSCDDGILLDEPTFRVRAVQLDHKIPCLAFALEEKQHINVWKNRLDELGLPTGAWLRELKRTVLRGAPDSEPFRVRWQQGGRRFERLFPLGQLKDEILRIVPGQKIAYVVDAIYHRENARRIAALARDADVFFVEAGFLQQDADRAVDTHHLTARQAGRLGRDARVKRLVPFHFSTRYSGQEAGLRQEAEHAFLGRTGQEP